MVTPDGSNASTRIFSNVDLQDRDVSILSDGHGNIIRCLEMDNYYLNARAIAKGKIPDPRKNFPRLRSMQLREDDIFLLAYPKAGTHWISEVIFMLRTGKTEYDIRKKEEAMLEFQTPETLDELPSPRTLNSHLRFSMLPHQLVEKRHKIVFVKRNPKDIAVSFYFHTKHVMGYTGTFLQYVDMFMYDKVYFHPWAEYMSHWEDVFKTYPKELVHVVIFEDMKKNPVCEVKKLATFLEVECNEILANSIAEKCNFDNLKEANSKAKIGRKDQFYRKGTVGDWKNWFTVAKSEEFDRFLQPNVNRCDRFEYTYDLV